VSGSVADRAKRFYKTATHGLAKDGQGFHILLDGRTLRTPAKALLVLPNETLATAIAAEWDAQIEHIAPAKMPLTRLANVAIDRMPVSRAETIAQLVAYAETDLLLSRAGEPDTLAAAEAAAWDPILDWAAESLCARLVPEVGIIAGRQDRAALERLAEQARALDDLRLTAVAHLGACLGSTLLALAVLKGRLDHAAAFAFSRVDETYQEARWGVDHEAAQRTQRLAEDVAAAARFLSALDS
jgi:chaperone required for assembly of F1-ATPase